jgi:hypothetical protein
VDLLALSPKHGALIPLAFLQLQLPLLIQQGLEIVSLPDLSPHIQRTTI